MGARCDSSRARAALRGLKADFNHAVEDGCRVAATNAQAAAIATTEWKDRTGKTRKTIRASVTKRGFRLTGRGASVFLENGTSAHVIAATGKGTKTWETTVSYSGGTASTSSKRGKAKYLRFVINGAVYFRRSVYHPGTRATFFLEQSVVEGAQAMSRNFPRVFARDAAKRGLAR